MSDSVRPHRRQPTRLPRPWDSPGKSTGVGCHFLLQCMKVKTESEVARLCPTLSDPMDHSLPGFSIHGIFQARVLEWVVLDFVNSVMKKDPQIWSYTENFIHPRPPCGCFSSGLCSPSIRPLDYPSIAFFNFISVFIPAYPPSYSIFYLI